jgi:hypothetical protein
MIGPLPDTSELVGSLDLFVVESCEKLQKTIFREGQV